MFVHNIDITQFLSKIIQSILRLILMFVHLKCDTNIKSLQITKRTRLKDVVHNKLPIDTKIIFNERKISRSFYRSKIREGIVFYMFD